MTSKGDDAQSNELTFLETCKSVLWAMLGVRSKTGAQKDLSNGKASHFIVIGLFFAVIFIVCLAVIVMSVIPST